MMRRAVVHVSVGFLLCVGLVNTGLFADVDVDLSSEHYAERRVDGLPAFLAMPCNCVVNVGYVCVGLYWLLWRGDDAESERARYLRHVFALMAVFYGPVQWTRLAMLRRAPAVLDQWLTLPIFAWVPVWIDFIERRTEWRASHAATLELGSVLSYGLAIAHRRGFDTALAGHVLFGVYKGVAVQRTHGDVRTRRHLVLALLSCAGFVLLKLLDHHLAQYRLFQRFTGHFWSKVCDVLQFHFSFCFLTRLTSRARAKTEAQQQ